MLLLIQELPKFHLTQRTSIIIADNSVLSESLSSCSSKDLSQLISTWMDPQNCKEYAKELEKSSGSDFHRSVLNRRRTTEFLLASRKGSLTDLHDRKGSSTDLLHEMKGNSADFSQKDLESLLVDKMRPARRKESTVDLSQADLEDLFVDGTTSSKRTRSSTIDSQDDLDDLFENNKNAGDKRSVASEDSDKPPSKIVRCAQTKRVCCKQLPP